MRIRLPAAALAAAAILLVPAATAGAATVSDENGATVYRGEGTEGLSLIVSTYEDWSSGVTYLRLADSGANRQAIVSGPCFMSDGYDPQVLCPLNPSKPLRIEGSAGDDALSIYSADVPDAMPIQINGGAGNDRIKDAYDSQAGRVLTGGPGDDLIEGYAGNDVIDGGDGNDEVDGGEGNDQVRGGAGDDVMWGDHYKRPGADLLDGGPGVDTTEEWSIPSDLERQPAVNVTLDGRANDGRPGENDNVIGIERLDMYVVGSYTGTNGGERIKLVNLGNDGPSRLIGLGGNDTLIGNDFDDTVDGGAGDDTVEGGHGNDVVTGGPGRDVIYGDATSAHCGWYSCKVPYGNDVIYARDGEVDSIDCGIGTDRAVVDAIDVVANCETVDRGAGGAPSGGGGAGGPSGPAGGGGGGPAAPVALSMKAPKTPRALGGRGVKVGVACPAACTVAGALHVDRKAARTLRLRSTKLGTARGGVAAAGTARLTLRVPATARRRLRTLRSARLTVRLTVTHASGAVERASRTLTVRR